MRHCSSQRVWVPTPFASAVGTAIAEAATENQGSPGEVVVVVDSLPHTGKTSAVERVMLRQTAEVWRSLGTGEAGEYPRIPWIYAKCGPASGPLNLISAVADAFGRRNPSGSTDSLTRWVLDIAFETGCVGLALDEVHEIKGVHAPANAHLVRNLIADFPGVVVLMGAGLDHSALLNGVSRNASIASDQVVRRMLTVRGDEHQLARDSEGWQHFLRQIASQAHLTNGEGADVFLDPEVCALMHDLLDGGIGAAARCIREAAIRSSSDVQVFEDYIIAQFDGGGESGRTQRGSSPGHSGADTT